jgi:DNA-binding transcriptional regulator/RsmH inhibitor MraZ
MASRARVDERGRLQLPRGERESAHIPTNSEVLVVPKSPGHLELILVGEPRLEHFQKKIRGRLKNWKEEEHRADKALRELSLASDKRQDQHK